MLTIKINYKNGDPNFAYTSVVKEGGFSLINSSGENKSDCMQGGWISSNYVNDFRDTKLEYIGSNYIIVSATIGNVCESNEYQIRAMVRSESQHTVTQIFPSKIKITNRNDLNCPK